ncbi:DUF2007 domain-containing protein [Flavobacteriales bacterium]|nr:DUF2007 domain-containing protein [Flavobacteriales bacterium]
MKRNWINIFSADKHIEVEIIKQMLKENNIISVILSKQDSSYNMFGTIDLYVPENEKEISLRLIRKTK